MTHLEIRRTLLEKIKNPDKFTTLEWNYMQEKIKIIIIN